VTVQRGLLLLVQLIVQQQMRLLCIEPALVSVLRACVAVTEESDEAERDREGAERGARRGREDGPSKEFDGVFVSDVYDGESVFVVIEANLMLRVLRVWAAVDDTLGIVSVAIVSIAAWRE
jgi:hypothetical protein